MPDEYGKLLEQFSLPALCYLKEFLRIQQISHFRIFSVRKVRPLQQAKTKDFLVSLQYQGWQGMMPLEVTISRRGGEFRRKRTMARRGQHALLYPKGGLSRKEFLTMVARAANGHWAGLEEFRKYFEEICNDYVRRQGIKKKIVTGTEV